MEYKYVNGRKLLLNAWDYTGSKMIINGNGSLVLREYGIITTEYIDGQKKWIRNKNVI
jgi:hypothetical protein